MLWVVFLLLFSYFAQATQSAQRRMGDCPRRTEMYLSLQSVHERREVIALTH